MPATRMTERALGMTGSVFRSVGSLAVSARVWLFKAFAFLYSLVKPPTRPGIKVSPTALSTLHLQSLAQPDVLPLCPEWRKVDFLAELPVELSIRILKYLPPTGPIRLRLVSKTYHELLTSEEVCRSLSYNIFRRGYRVARELESWRLHYENYVSRRLSYRSGRAWVTETLPPMRFKSFCPETSHLAGVLKNWSVLVLDLSTHPAEFVFPPTRPRDSSRIKRVILLPSFVVVLTKAHRGYSWNLETRRLYQFEVPELGDSTFDFINGHGNLIVIPSRDFVMVHDVQAEKSSRFGSISAGTGIRKWMGGGKECIGSVVVANAEKRVVWVLRRFHTGCFLDGVHWETGEVVLGERRSPRYHLQPYCEDGLWQFWGTGTFSFHPGSTRHTKNAQTPRAVFDIGTGAWTEETYTIIFPYWVGKPRSANSLSGPWTRSDGLGCFVEVDPCLQVWMLDQEPGEWVARARTLDPNDLAGFPISVNGYFCRLDCLGISDKFVLLGDSEGEGAVVVRFKGIHE